MVLNREGCRGFGPDLVEEGKARSETQAVKEKREREEEFSDGGRTMTLSSFNNDEDVMIEVVDNFRVGFEPK